MGKELNDAVRTILFTVFFNLVLPSVDSGSDIRLGIRLYINNHPRWAMAVLAPVIINTVFTVFACREIERKLSKKPWILHLPLVFLQLYPQYCICRLMYKYFRGEISLQDLITSRDSMDGGLGCVEPYCESVPQVFVQTAIFAFVHNINPMIKKLCYTQRERPCALDDSCDDLFNCDRDKFASGYNHYATLASLDDVMENRTTQFDECISPFKACIGSCQENLTQTILGLNENTLFDAVMNHKAYYNHNLTIHYNATQHDMERIQMHLLVIGNYELFISTYVISVIAAAYGMSKFFRLGHARITSSLMSRKFVLLCLFNSTSLVLKGLALASIVMGNDGSLLNSTLWWLCLIILPHFLLFVLFTVIVPCRELYRKSGISPFRLITNIIAKQPSIIMAPHITPFIFTLGKMKITDAMPTTEVNGKTMKELPCYTTYGVCVSSILNFIVLIISTSAAICWKDNWIIGGWKVLFVLLMVFGLPIMMYIVYGSIDCYCSDLDFVDFETSMACIKHDKDECLECISVYGLYLERYYYFEACTEHENKKPYQSDFPTSICQKCRMINCRYTLYIYTLISVTICSMIH